MLDPTQKPRYSLVSQVECPFCNAKIGKPCKTASGVKRGWHQRRRHRANFEYGTEK